MNCYNIFAGRYLLYRTDQHGRLRANKSNLWDKHIICIVKYTEIDIIVIKLISIETHRQADSILLSSPHLCLSSHICEITDSSICVQMDMIPATKSIEGTIIQVSFASRYCMPFSPQDFSTAPLRSIFRVMVFISKLRDVLMVSSSCIIIVFT
jgi:hypothetical protein